MELNEEHANECERGGGEVFREAKLVKRRRATTASERGASLLPFPSPFPSKIRGTMPRVIYPALKEARHPGYKRDNKEY